MIILFASEFLFQEPPDYHLRHHHNSILHYDCQQISSFCFPYLYSDFVMIDPEFTITFKTHVS